MVHVEAVEVKRIPEMDSVEKIPEMDSVEKMPEMDSLEKIPEMDSVEKMPEMDSVEKIPEMDSVETMPEMDWVEKIPEMDSAEKMPEMDSVEKIPEMGPVEAVEKILNYSFENKSLLREALTPTSTSTMKSSMKSPLFERLEFLGDSVLGLAFTNHIHFEYPNLDLKEQRALRSINVCNEKFARNAVNHGLHKLLIHDGDHLVNVENFLEAVSKEDGPLWYARSVKAPKILADLVESIAGAVYVDLNLDIQRLWEIFRCLLEPMLTLKDLRQQQKPVNMLSRLGDKLKRRIEIRCRDCKDGGITAEVYLDDTCIASGSAKQVCVAKMLAATEALRKLSESEPVEKVISDSVLVVEAEDTKGKLSEICSTEKLQIQTGSSSLPSTSGTLLTEMTPTTDEDCLHVEPEDVKGKMVETCSTRKLPLQNGSSGLPTASENPLTYEMTQKQMVIDEYSLEVEPVYAKAKLREICTKRKWPNPIFSIEEVGVKHDKRFVCSVKIKIPTMEGAFHTKGEERARKKEAENSSAYHMLRALKSPLMSLVLRSPEMQESVGKKKKKNLQRKMIREMDSVEVEAVEKILKYSFVNKGLLKDALTRSPYEKLSSVSRLQFLGGAALSLAFTTHFYLSYPNYEPKELTPLRWINITKEKFGRDAIKHGLYQFLIGEVPDEKARKFIEAVSKEDDPLPYGGISNAPRILGDVIETVAGAIYIDVNFDVRRLWEICRFLFEPVYTLDDLRRQPQPLATLFRLADKHGKRVEFRYCDGEPYGPTVAQVYLDDTYIACGNPRGDIHHAKLTAAKKALQKLSEGMPIEMVVDEDSLDIEIEDAKEKLIEICNKRKWPNPIYSIEKAGKGLVCSAVKIETPTEEGTLYIKGDKNKKRKIAENSSASLMIRALKFHLKDDL
ncbi:unnamed protein product [Thlaspi arvense]|uniref:Uncharacterized protein n=1 Tax=Thlaspi arvense TaxID=13288 RepID=A0AAU9RNE1_THLAR|nr:unnamed protein product [Thlaspi arvense]